MEHLIAVSKQATTIERTDQLPGHLNALVQERLTVSKILERARWFALWLQPQEGVAPYVFAGLEESDQEMYGYCLWARRNGRVQKMAYTLNKAALHTCLEERNCDLTAEVQIAQQFLQRISRQMTQLV